MTRFSFLAPGVSTYPDGVDGTLTLFYVVLILGLPMLGYVLMAIDLRRWLRSLRRALVLVKTMMPVTPYWALAERPPCLKALDLTFPCTREEVIAAYREQAKYLHPDRGGDLQQFLRLQKHFEQALQLINSPPEEM